MTYILFIYKWCLCPKKKDQYGAQLLKTSYTIIYTQANWLLVTELLFNIFKNSGLAYIAMIV